jgi:hypothetical protein
MRTRRPIAVATLLLSAALLTGCTSGNAQQPAGQTPEAVDGEALLTSLAEVAPGLDDDASLAVADQICQDIEDGVATEDIDEYAIAEFSEIADEPIDEGQVQDAISVITSNWCE